MTKKAFTVCTFEGLDPAYVTTDDPDNPQFWTLHLRTAEPAKLASAINMTGAEVLTGDFVGGDSWRQWCEKSEGPHDRALHVYLQAPNPWTASLAAAHLLEHIGWTDPAAFSLSEALDWANQVRNLGSTSRV